MNAVQHLPKTLLLRRFLRLGLPLVGLFAMQILLTVWSLHSLHTGEQWVEKQRLWTQRAELILNRVQHGPTSLSEQIFVEQLTENQIELQTLERGVVSHTNILSATQFIQELPQSLILIRKLSNESDWNALQQSRQRAMALMHTIQTIGAEQLGSHHNSTAHNNASRQQHAQELNALLQLSPHIQHQWRSIRQHAKQVMGTLLLLGWAGLLVLGLRQFQRLIFRSWKYEKSAQQFTERWNYVLNNLDDAMWDWSPSQAQLSLSKRWFTQLHYPAPVSNYQAHDLQFWLNLLHPLDQANIYSVFQTLNQQESQLISFEARMRCLDNSYRWIRTQIQAIDFDHKGRATNYMGVNIDIQEQRTQQQQLNQLSQQDHLTLLPNHASFLSLLEQQVTTRMMLPHPRPFALVHIDFDNFRLINNEWGTMVGDGFLRHAAKRLSHLLGPGDYLARTGANEFRFLIEHYQAPTLFEEWLHRLQTSLQTDFSIDNYLISATVSIGSTLFPENGKDMQTLQTQAELALREAQKCGGAQHIRFHPILLDKQRQQHRMIQDLRQAMQRREFYLAYQPIIDSRTGLATKAEALLRWKHPSYGNIMPATFIPLAESNGLIANLSEWVFEQVQRDLPELLAVLGPTFQVSINASPRQFRHQQSRFSHWPSQIQASTLGKNLCLEITEGILMDASHDAQVLLQSFRETGVQIALDDFGTGYSSLAYLREFKIDILKIDQSFIESLASGRSEVTLCEAMIKMGHKLGIQVVAEGVETSEQQAILVNIGCDFLQGFLFNTPQPLQEFLVWAKWHQKNEALVVEL